MEESTEPKLSKKQLKKLERQRAKEAAKAKAAEERAKQEAAAAENDVSKGLYGDAALIQSTERGTKIFTHVRDLSNQVDKEVTVRARAENVRVAGNLAFMVLRQSRCTVQDEPLCTLQATKEHCKKANCKNAVAAKSETVSKLMLKFIAKISKESLVEVKAKVVRPEAPVESCSVQDAELQLLQVFVVSRAADLPIQLSDCARPQPILDEQTAKMAALDAEESELKEALEAETDDEKKKELEEKLKAKQDEKGTAATVVVLALKQRLDNRIIDLRTNAHNAIFRIQSGVCRLFRDFLTSHNFVELHSPKLISTASEGGATVFRVDYFKGNAYLAQSPQFYKQMAICADFERVFEIGPVFRAENAFTHRHMTEFTGLDFEMQFEQHYHEVMDFYDQLFISIFDGLNRDYKDEIEAVRRQYPFEDLQYRKDKSLVLHWKEMIAILRENGKEIGDLEDIDTETEKKLGGWVKEKYGVDFYIVDKFPLHIRPFYTMPDPQDDDYSNSYDVFLRGQEIMSGAQRVHDYELLCKRVESKGVEVETVRSYVDAFKYGCPPHAGGGVGMERVVMLFLSLYDIRQCSLFPRDPKRLNP